MSACRNTSLPVGRRWDESSCGIRAAGWLRSPSTWSRSIPMKPGSSGAGCRPLSLFRPDGRPKRVGSNSRTANCAASPPRQPCPRSFKNFAHRGRYQQESFSLTTRFPFAFLTKKRRVALTREIVVYPPIEPADEFFEVLPLITGEFETFVRGRGSDLYRLREYTQEDSARHVDWKATASSLTIPLRARFPHRLTRERSRWPHPSAGTLRKRTRRFPLWRRVTRAARTSIGSWLTWR